MGMPGKSLRKSELHKSYYLYHCTKQNALNLHCNILTDLTAEMFCNILFNQLTWQSGCAEWGWSECQEWGVWWGVQWGQLVHGKQHSPGCPSSRHCHRGCLGCLLLHWYPKMSIFIPLIYLIVYIIQPQVHFTYDFLPLSYKYYLRQWKQNM